MKIRSKVKWFEQYNEICTTTVSVKWDSSTVKTIQSGNIIMPYRVTQRANSNFNRVNEMSITDRVQFTTVVTQVLLYIITDHRFEFSELKLTKNFSCFSMCLTYALILFTSISVKWLINYFVDFAENLKKCNVLKLKSDKLQLHTTRNKLHDHMKLLTTCWPT